MKSNSAIDKLLEKAIVDPDFEKELRDHPVETLSSIGVKVDDDVRKLLSEVNWQAKDLSAELKQRTSKINFGAVFGTGTTSDPMKSSK